jgi:hypothetical protein
MSYAISVAKAQGGALTGTTQGTELRVTHIGTISINFYGLTVIA